MESWLFHFFASNQGGHKQFLCPIHDIRKLLIALVTYGEPTPSNDSMHEESTPKWGNPGEGRGGSGVNGRHMVRLGILPLTFFPFYVCYF